MTSNREWIHGQCVGCPVPAECGKRCPDLVEDLSGLKLAWLPGARLPATPAEIAPLVDHTILIPEATRDVIERACEDAARFGFAAVCVNSAWVETCARALRGTRVKVSSTVGFPLGAAATPAKIAEAREAVAKGASELDVVLHVGLVRGGADADARDDLREVIRAVPGILVKAVLETCCLSEGEKARAARLALDAGAHALKTTTGFGPGGANLRDVALLRSIAGTGAGVKASGGIRDRETVLAMLAHGANRIGSSASAKFAVSR